MDKGLQTYDAYRLAKAIEAGDTDEAAEISAEIALGVATDGFTGNVVAIKIASAVEKFGLAALGAKIVGKFGDEAGGVVSKSGNYVPAPKELEGFSGLNRANPKTPIQGGGGLRSRWKDQKGNIYEWDSQHGAIEKYNKSGKHLGEFDPNTGKQTKPAVPGRRVEP
jgi:hypothetical protein